MELHERAERLLHLHRGKILVLPNAWDVASARVVEEAGFPAVATSSAGVAAVVGYSHGGRAPPGGMLEKVVRLRPPRRLPRTAVLEAGARFRGQTVEAPV